MRLGTKILILTLLITSALAGGISFFVSQDLRRHETNRARDEIRRAVSRYFDKTDHLHSAARSVVRLIMGDPQYRAEIEKLEAVGADRDRAVAQFSLEIFGRLVQQELTASANIVAPRFEVLLNRDGKVLVASAPVRRAHDAAWDQDAKLAASLQQNKIAWPVTAALAAPVDGARAYVRVDGVLYLVMAVPLSVEATGEPSYVCLIGYRIDTEWTRLLLSDADDRLSLVAVFHDGGTQIGYAATRDAPEIARGLDTAIAGVLAQKTAADTRAPIEFDAGEQTFVGEVITFSPAPGAFGGLGVASSLTSALEELHSIQRKIAGASAVVMLLAIVAFFFVSRWISRPIGQLVSGTERVARGDFSSPVLLRRKDELGTLAVSFNQMSDGLRQRDLIKDTFGKFVDPKIVERYIADPSLLAPGGDRRVHSVLFSDLAGFSRLSEVLASDELVRLLNAYLAGGADAVTQTGGVVDKFIGDAIVAFWGPPICENHAVSACRAAMTIVAIAKELNDRCQERGLPGTAARVGISTGDVLVGIIGSPNRYSYTVMGDTVNLGSRIEGLNKLYGSSVLVDEATARATGSAFISRKVDVVRVVGRDEPVTVYEIVAELTTNDGPAARRRCQEFEVARSAYERGDFAAAEKGFRSLAQTSNDPVVTAMADRCRRLQRDRLPEDWDGVWTAEQK